MRVMIDLQRTIIAYGDIFTPNNGCTLVDIKDSLFGAVIQPGINTLSPDNQSVTNSPLVLAASGNPPASVTDYTTNYQQALADLDTIIAQASNPAIVTLARISKRTVVYLKTIAS